MSRPWPYTWSQEPKPAQRSMYESEVNRILKEHERKLSEGLRLLQEGKINDYRWREGLKILSKICTIKCNLAEARILFGSSKLIRMFEQELRQVTEEGKKVLKAS